MSLDEFPKYDDEPLVLNNLGEKLGKIGALGVAIILYLAIAPIELFKRFREKNN